MGCKHPADLSRRRCAPKPRLPHLGSPSPGSKASSRPFPGVWGARLPRGGMVAPECSSWKLLQSILQAILQKAKRLPTCRPAL